MRHRLRRQPGEPAALWAASECYYKVVTALPAADLEPVRQTLCSTEPLELLRAARAINRLYQQLAPPLAQAHGISSPAAPPPTRCKSDWTRDGRAPDAKPN